MNGHKWNSIMGKCEVMHFGKKGQKINLYKWSKISNKVQSDLGVLVHESQNACRVMLQVVTQMQNWLYCKSDWIGNEKTCTVIGEVKLVTINTVHCIGSLYLIEVILPLETVQILFTG